MYRDQEGDGGAAGAGVALFERDPGPAFERERYPPEESVKRKEAVEKVPVMIGKFLSLESVAV